MPKRKGQAMDAPALNSVNISAIPTPVTYSAKSDVVAQYYHDKALNAALAAEDTKQRNAFVAVSILTLGTLLAFLFLKKDDAFAAMGINIVGISVIKVVTEGTPQPTPTVDTTR